MRNFLILFVGMVLTSMLAAEPVTEKNWKFHPEIVSIRGIYNNTKLANCSEFPSFDSYSFRCDADNRIRAIIVDYSSGGSGASCEYFYDEKGRLRFIFGQAWPDGDGPFESRSYFREDGSLIYGDHGDSYNDFKNPVYFIINELKEADETIGALEDQIREGRRKTVELDCKEALFEFRKSLGGNWQFQMIDPTWVSKDFQIPKLTLPGHMLTAGIQEYATDIILNVSATEIALDGSKLKDTGKWGYVRNPAGSGGRVFIDCSHTDYKGSKWYTW